MIPGALHPAGLHTLGFGGAGRSAAFSSRCSFILGSAFRLDDLGNKSSLRPGVALHQGLRFVDKRIRQRVGANVANGERLPLTLQHKINAARKVANASDRDGAPDAHALASCGAIQRLQLSDRVVVGLALSIAQPRQKTERGYDYANSHSKFRLFLHAITPPPPPT